MKLREKIDKILLDNTDITLSLDNTTDQILQAFEQILPEEKDKKDAPIELNQDEAWSWVCGYNQYRAELLELMRGEK